ncbi:MAG TPA: class I SAM-dependent methyltransferase [Vicinamibacterales bacterium]|nr:class I SAM-dependent methyltransferase [Vicinamibacterales bacterium]
MSDPWSAPDTVAGFVRSPPNDVLMSFAERERRRPGAGRALDLGCGAGRNAVPMAQQGWSVTGVDLSWPMLAAAAERARQEGVSDRFTLIRARMDGIPIASASCDLVIAHGIWNLAGSARELRAAVAEAARVARPGAALFVFTFSRHTLPDDAVPIAGEPFAFTQFSGRPQTFLTETQLMDLLDAHGFSPEPAVPLTEYNRSPSIRLAGGPPVIYEAAFRRRS